MKNRERLQWTVILLAVAGALAWRMRASEETLATTTVSEARPERSDRRSPKLVELGSDSCASCRAMFPVLDELRSEHAGTLEVEFIDVWKSPESAQPYGVRVIPTQVLLAPDGTELARHEGFYAADAIRTRFAELGHELEPGGTVQ